MEGSSRAFRVALSVATLLGRSRKVTLFAALVAGAGLVHELSQRASTNGSTNEADAPAENEADAPAEVPAGSA
jgi:hypothetical protein